MQTELSLPGYLRVENLSDVRIFDKIGSGGGGSIHHGQAVSLKLQQEVNTADCFLAVKTFPSTSDITSFCQEVAIMSRLSMSPYIVRLHGYIDEPNYFTILMVESLNEQFDMDIQYRI